MILPLVHLPSRVLRIPTQPLTFPLKKSVIKLIHDMVDTVKKANGVGLAAPQIGQNLQLAIIYIPEAKIPPFAIINPKITEKSLDTEPLEEGCLSIPGVFGQVSRPKKITVKTYDLEGKSFSITDDGFLAKVLQHEIDHLNNRLIIDCFDNITRGKELLNKYKEKV